MPVKENIDTATTMATFGLSPVIEEPEVEDRVYEDDSESGEPEEEVDTLEDTDDESEGIDDEDEDLEDEEDEDSEQSPDVQKEIKRREAAEKQMREWQSRHDQLQAQVSQMLNDFNQLKAKQETQSDGLADLDIDDEELIDGKTLKKLIAQQTKKGSSEDAQYKQYYLQLEQAQNQYLGKLDDLQDVKEYVDQNRLAQDPEISQIPTNTVGLYYAVKARRLQDEIDTLRKEKSKMIKRKKRNPLPPTGGKRSSSSVSQDLSDFEKKYFGFMKSRGFEPSNHRKGS